MADTAHRHKVARVSIGTRHRVEFNRSACLFLNATPLILLSFIRAMRFYGELAKGLGQLFLLCTAAAIILHDSVQIRRCDLSPSNLATINTDPISNSIVFCGASRSQKLSSVAFDAHSAIDKRLPSAPSKHSPVQK